MVKIQPGMGVFAMFPNQNYKPWLALGEMVDNSIQSYLENKARLRKLHGPKFQLHIQIEFDSNNKCIYVIDNAAGIAENDVERAFTLAVRRTDRSGLGQFGIGMKSAAIWYSNFFTIESRALGEKIGRKVTFDIPSIIENEITELEPETFQKEEIEHGTIVQMSQLHQGLPAPMTLKAIRNYLSSIYRGQLRNPDVKITVDKQDLSFHELDCLISPFWNSDKGPTENQSDALKPDVVWKRYFEFELRDSWVEDDAPDRPDEPPVISGWIGILKNGDTKKSGLALLWRGKVVVGAGSMAQGDSDSYRPQTLFGASTTFPYQRLFGEIDVSTLGVTTYKDGLTWRPGQEENLQSELRKVIRGLNTLMQQDFVSDHGEIAKTYSFWAMANNFRSTQKDEEVITEVQKSAEKVANASTLALQEALTVADLEIDEIPQLLFTPLTSESSEVEASFLIFRDSRTHFDYLLELIRDPEVEDLVSLVEKPDNQLSIRVNRQHPFMESFAHLPGADLDPILRLCVATALSHVRAKTLELPNWYEFLLSFNDVVRNRLSSQLNLPKAP